MVLHRFLVCLVLLSALPLLATTGHEVSPLAYGPSASGASDVLIASNGSTFLTVWASGPSPFQGYLFASLLDAEGRLLTPAAKPILAATNAYPIQLLSAGRNYVLVWSSTDSPVQVTIISPELDAVRTFALPTRSTGRLAASGDRLLYVTAPDDSAATALFLDLEGNVVRRSMMMRDRIANSYVVAVVAEDDGFAVLFSGTIGLVVQRIGFEGDVRPAVTVLAPSRSARQPGSIAMASGNGVLLVTWTLSAPVVPPEILRAAVVDANDRLSAVQDIAINGSAVRLLDAERYAGGFRLFAHSGEWRSNISLQLSSWQIELASDGLTVIPTTAVPEGTSRMISDVAVNGDAIVAAGADFVVDQGYASGARAIAVRLDRTADAQILSVAPRQQILPAAVTDGLDFFVVWPESTARSNVLAHARVDRDASPIPSSGDDGSLTMRRPSRPAIAFGGSLYLTVWNDGADLAGAMIFSSGAVWRTLVIRRQIASLDDPAVVWDGRRFALAWIENGSVYGTFVGLDGSVAEPRLWAPPIPDEDSVIRISANPAIAWNGSSLLVGWTSVYSGIICTCVPPPSHAYVRLMNADGIPVGSTLHLARGPWAIHLASNGEGFLGVTEDADGVSAAPIDVRGVDLVARRSIPVFEWIGAPSTSVAFDGVDYVIALRYGTWFAPVKSWLMTARVNRAGALADRRFTALEQTVSNENPAVAVNGGGDVLLAASAIRPDVASPRVYTFLQTELDPLPAPPAPPTVVNATRYSCGPNWSYPCGKTIITWSGTSAEGGYVIEARSTEGGFYFARYAPAGATSVTLDWPAEAVRVRAFGPGGVSEPSEPLAVVDPTRRRSSGR